MMTDQTPEDPEFFKQIREEIEAADEAQRVRPNGHIEDWSALPAIDQADVARWKDRTPAEIIFTIEDLAPLGMVTLLTSIGGAGKTLLMQMAATAIASGNLSFLGKRCLVGKTAGVFAEDPDTMLHLRQTRINDQWNLNYDQIAGRMFLQSYFGLSAQLWRQGKATDFMEQLEAQLRRIEGLRLLTLDNAALLYSGDENDRPEVTEFISVLNGLAYRLDIGIILSAHASKSSDGTALRVTSGSTAWVNASRSVLELKRDEDGQGACLTVVKANHAATGTTIPLEWRDKLLVPVGAATGILGSIERRACERVFLDLLEKMATQGRYVSHHPRTSNYAPKMFAALPGSERYGSPDFIKAMEALFDQKKIAVGSYMGPSRHKHECVVRVIED
jgi:AAA domain-containing protein